MSPQDKVERVLKEMHVTFSQSPTYNGQPDKIILDRRQFLALLDRLNNGIYDMMEQYEQTRQSRQNAERAFRKKGDEIIEEANSSADDIYAASVIYTSDTIGRIRDLMDETNESMNDLFRRFRKELKEQKNLLKSHETELQSQLADLADTKKYLSIIEDINRQRKRENLDKAAAKEAEPRGAVRYPQQARSTVPSGAQIHINEEYFEKTGKERPDAAPTEEAEAKPLPVEKPDIRVNMDSPYFKWKAQQEAQQKKEQEKQGSFEADDIASDGKDADNAEVDPEIRDDEDTKTGAVESGETAAPSDIVSAEESDIPGSHDAEDAPSDPAVQCDADAVQPNPEFPDEEAIRQAVLEDELAWEREKQEQSEQETVSAGRFLKNLFFGKDEK